MVPEAVQNICALKYSVPLAIKHVGGFDRWNAHCAWMCHFLKMVSHIPQWRFASLISTSSLAVPSSSCRFFALRYYGWTVLHHLSQRQRFFSDSFGSPREWKICLPRLHPISKDSKANRMECRTVLIWHADAIVGINRNILKHCSTVRLYLLHEFQ